MMDEYIPSPRQTPNKPRRMRDVSALYPVDEKKLLLEALLKRQGDGDTPAPAPTPTPRAPRGPWRDDRACPVCRWTSTSPASSDDDAAADESDEPSACGGRAPDLDSSSSVSSDSADDEEEEEDGGEGGEDGAAGAPDEPGDVAADAQELTVEDAAQKGDQLVEAGDVSDNAPQPHTVSQAPQVGDLADCPPERDSHPSAGKLLYGRHCLWYQSAGFVRPQGGK